MQKLLICGCPRSGTTFLGTILNSARNILIFEELGAFNPDRWNNALQHLAAYSNVINLNFDLLNKKNGFDFLGDKMPDSLLHIEFILSIFKNIKVYVCIRDGRYVIESMLPKFGWGFERAQETWCKYASKLYEYTTGGILSDLNFCLIRYEDYFNSYSYNLKKVFDFVNMEVPPIASVLVESTTQLIPREYSSDFMHWQSVWGYPTK